MAIKLPRWAIGKNLVPYENLNISTDYRANVIASAKIMLKNNKDLSFSRSDLSQYIECSKVHLSRIWKTIKLQNLHSVKGNHYHIDLYHAKKLNPNQFKLLDYLCRQCNIGLKGQISTTFSVLANTMGLTWQGLKNEIYLLQKQGLITIDKDKRKTKRGYYNITICSSTEKQTYNCQKKTNHVQEKVLTAKNTYDIPKPQSEEERRKCLEIFNNFLSKI